MTKYARKKRQKEEQKQEMAQIFKPQPWISMKSGVKVIWVASIVMAVLTAWQVIPQRGIWEGILWGLVFGALIWLIFWGYYLFNRFMRRLR